MIPYSVGKHGIFLPHTSQRVTKFTHSPTSFLLAPRKTPDTTVFVEYLDMHIYKADELNDCVGIVKANLLCLLYIH